MKRTNQLIKQIIDSDNMRLAWLQTIRGKRDKRSVLLFREHLNDNLVMMAQQLEQGRYPWGHFCRFTIYDPKERQISVAPLRDRIAYHAIINVCEPVFERYQIDQSCACRKGRGQSEALRLATMYSRRNEWFLKLDIRKYFDSISHRYLKEQLLRLFKDTFVVKAFFDLIDSYEANIPDFGLPIGSLTSQFFANHYLGVMDHYIKETLHVRSYVRYMDDFILWENSSERLKECYYEIKEFLLNRLALTPKPMCLNRIGKGLPFLGYRLYPGQIRLSQRSRKRFRKKYIEGQRKYENGQWSEEETRRHIEPLLAFVEKADSIAFRRRTFEGN